MELKKEHLGSKVFIKRLGREVVVSEENKVTLISNNLRHLFVYKKPVNDSIKSNKPKRSKRGADTSSDES